MRSPFRKSALARLSSPEQLDELLYVTSSYSWLTLVAIAVLLSAVVYWGFAGTIPVQISAPTVLVNTGGIKTIAATQAGQITQLALEVGDMISNEQAVAEITTLAEGSTASVNSLQAGQIISVRTDLGAVVERGDVLAQFERVGDGIQREAHLFLDAAAVTDLAIGMPVTITPRAGGVTLSGEIVEIGEYPLSEEEISRFVGNPALVEQLTESQAPIQVRVVVDDSAEIVSGSLADAEIAIETLRPIDFVLPLR